MLTAAQLDAMTRLADQWSFLWDKRRQLWIAAEDSPNGEQIKEADLDALLSHRSTAGLVGARPCLGVTASRHDGVSR
ncbi:MAG: hypothetical protein ACRDPY_20130 [Streptosporangiaceae bacterium]